jgi:hypothetical protein
MREVQGSIPCSSTLFFHSYFLRFFLGLKDKWHALLIFCFFFSWYNVSVSDTDLLPTERRWHLGKEETKRREKFAEGRLGRRDSVEGRNTLET